MPRRLARKPSTASLTPAIRKIRNAICIWPEPIAHTTTGTSKMRPIVIRLGRFKTATPGLPVPEHNQPDGNAKGNRGEWSRGGAAICRRVLSKTRQRQVDACEAAAGFNQSDGKL